MDPTVILELAHEALRLINNIIEGQPAEVRRASALAFWAAWEPVVMLFVDEPTRVAIRRAMGAEARTPTPPLS